MKLIEDTRQKPERHELKHQWWQENGVQVLRCKIPFGDYCLPPKVSVDTKADMLEIAGNIGGSTEEHNRFREELKLAQEFGCKLIILVENTDGITCIEDVASWKNPRRFESPKAIDGVRLSKAMATMQRRYGCEFWFCEPSEAARVIAELVEDWYGS